jgi:cell division protein ZapE
MPDDGGVPTGMPGPSRLYRQGVIAGRWQDDAAQRALLPTLDRLYAEVLADARGSWLRRLTRRPSSRATPRGLYLWGGVGRGKTFLIDLLANSLPSMRVLRRHFHRFMAEVHAQLLPLREQERSDPLAIVAQGLAREARLLCLDEFVVNDIGDAMILSELLEHLFAHGVALAATSNTVPSDLYHEGLQRARFLPAIALIERHCQVVELASPLDYRLRNLGRAPVYLVPGGSEADASLEQSFRRLAHGHATFDARLVIENRVVIVRALADDVAWFDFAVLCEGPRSVADYIELARSFGTVLISDVPVFGSRDRDDAAQRFIHLVDEFYDRKVKLVLSAAAEPTALYPSGRLRASFERTQSRLIEMQSLDYLALPHQP